MSVLTTQARVVAIAALRGFAPASVSLDLAERNLELVMQGAASPP